MARAFLKKAGWAGLFDVRVFGEETRRAKPNPDLYLLAAKRAGIDPGCAVVVEDSPNGVRAAKASGARVVGLGSRELARAGADETAPDIRRAAAVAARRLEAGCEAVYFGNRVRVTLRGKNAGESVVFRVLEASARKGGYEITGRFEPYAAYKRALKDRASDFYALGVGGVVTAGRGNGTRFLVGKRSRAVTAYKDFWELVPEGGIDAGCPVKSGRVDYASQILKELEEEARLDRVHVTGVRPVCIVKDAADRTYDVVCRVQLAGDPGKPKPDPKEHSSMKFMSRRETAALFGREREKVVPASLLFWDHFTGAKRTKGTA